jgi:hypothetical protein
MASTSPWPRSIGWIQGKKKGAWRQTDQHLLFKTAKTVNIGALLIGIILAIMFIGAILGCSELTFAKGTGRVAWANGLRLFLDGLPSPVGSYFFLSRHLGNEWGSHNSCYSNLLI